MLLLTILVVIATVTDQYSSKDEILIFTILHLKTKTVPTVTTVILLMKKIKQSTISEEDGTDSYK